MDLLLIGGVSGSGKSVALAALEDAGYYAVNNLPPTLLPQTIAHLAASGQHRVAMALDVKTGPGLPGLADTIARARTRWLRSACVRCSKTGVCGGFPKTA